MALIVSRKNGRARRNPPIKLVVLDRLFLLLRTGIKSAAACYGIYAGHELIKSIIDSKINWNAVLMVILTGDLARLLAILIAIIAIVVALYERHLRKILIAEHASYMKELEERIDVRRSSSKLLLDGTTRREDLDGN